MFETSKDILFLVIAFCVLWFTVFVCWMLYYMISIIGKVRKVIGNVQEKIDQIDDLIKLIKEKINSSANNFSLMLNAVLKIVDFVKEKRGDSSKIKNEEKESKE